MSTNFKIKKNEQFGRYLISEKHFNHGDDIWQESPLISSPLEVLDGSDRPTRFTCVSCYKEVDDNQRCEHCNWPCCNVHCSQNEQHEKFECKIFSARGIAITKSTFKMLMYLRMLLNKRLDPKKYRKYLTLGFNDYDEDVTLRWDHEEESRPIWTFLAEDCGMKVTLEDICRMHSAFNTNTFAFFHAENDTKYKGEVTYHYASLFANSCQPNLISHYLKTKTIGGGIRWDICFVARETIKPGDILTVAYNGGDLQFGTIARQGQIFSSRGFVCLCDRCLDKTEGGTFFQALVCPVCEEGNLLPEDHMDEGETSWTCDECGSAQNEYDYVVLAVLEKLKSLPYWLLDVPKGNAETFSLTMADEFMEGNRHLLHRNHFFMNICAMYWLIESNFSEKLMSSKKTAKALFVKILQRMDIYLPLCLKFMPPNCPADLYSTVAKAYAAYTLKCADMKTFGQSNYPLSFKLRLCRRISSCVHSSLSWRRLDINQLKQEHLSEYILWSGRVKDFQEQISQNEELALTSLRFLFTNV